VYIFKGKQNKVFLDNRDHMIRATSQKSWLLWETQSIYYLERFHQAHSPPCSAEKCWKKLKEHLLSGQDPAFFLLILSDLATLKFSDVGMH
jgi:hypothetical protein